MLRHDAHMACGMDFATLDGRIWCYEKWVARDADGNMIDKWPPHTRSDIVVFTHSGPAGLWSLGHCQARSIDCTGIKLVGYA